VSPMGPNYGSTTSQTGSGVSWSNLSNALVEDGVVASCGPVGPGGGGGTANQLLVTGLGFTIPPTAIIDGIKLEAKVQTTGGVQALDSGVCLAYNGGNTLTANTPNSGQFWPTGSLTWLTWGGPTSLWGKNWLYSDINSANFGASLAARPGSGTSTITVDSVRISVYWHTTPANVPKRYVYKVFNGNQYLGNLPQVTSDFAFSQEINTSGTQITITCAVSPDTSSLPTDILTNESGTTLTDESLNTLTTEGAIPIFAPGSFLTNALIKNGNDIQVWEFGYWNPNGKIVFLGEMQRIEANFGGSGGGSGGAAIGNTGDEGLTILCYSDGQDLDNYVVRGNPYTYTLDQANTNSNSSVTVSQSAVGWNFYGQTWKAGAGVTNLGAISILVLGTANLTINVYDSPALGTLLGTVTQPQSWSSQQQIELAFPTTITLIPGNTYFFTVSVDVGQSITLYYQNTDLYANGAMFNSNYSGGGGSTWVASPASSDLWFETFSGTGSTTGNFTAQDPTIGMTETFMSDYISRGGLITYTSSTIQATGLSLNYSFVSNTIYEALKAMLTLSPDGFYYTVDIGTDVLTFKRASTTPDIVLTKGRHLDQITIIFTIETIKNTALFTGGPVSGTNIYVTESNATSVALYGPRLDRPSDSGVLDAPTARVVALSDVIENKDEQYQTTVTIIDKTMDTTLLKPGLTVGFNGFGTFVDTLIAQIVRVDYTPEEVTLTLGRVPKRLVPSFEKITRGLVALQTVANPSAPS